MSELYEKDGTFGGDTPETDAARAGAELGAKHAKIIVQTIRKMFTIHKNDAGTEAYRDEYVQQLERERDAALHEADTWLRELNAAKAERDAAINALREAMEYIQRRNLVHGETCIRATWQRWTEIAERGKK